MEAMQTERTILLKPAAADYQEIFELKSNEQSRQFLGGPVAPDAFPEKFDAIMNAEAPECYWVVRAKANDAFIGLVCIALYHDLIHYEVSYELHPTFWGKGYGTEIIKKVVDHSFDILGLEEVYAETQKKNLASIRLLEKVGMHFHAQVERCGEEQVVYSMRRPAR